MGDELVENVHPRVSWGAVFAGTVTAMGLWMLLYAFGLAIGASTLNVRSPDGPGASGTFTGVWGIIVAPIVSLFVGGMVAGRGAGVARRGDGALQGLVTWGLAMVAGAWLTSALANVAGGLLSMGHDPVKALWGGFVALALGLVAAVAGGAAGVPGGTRRRRRERVAVAVPVDRAPAGPPREVFP